MVAELAALAAAIVVALAEILHARRVHRLARLAFGPSGRPSAWARSAPAARVVAASALAWGLTTLLYLKPMPHVAETLPEGQRRNVVLILDVSPSMRLKDAGPNRDQTRRARSTSVMESFFQRVPIEQYLLSVVAFYSGAKPVVVGTRDMEVVRNILADLPMQFAFHVGKTDLFAGLQEAERIAKPWRPKSTLLIILSDGDTVPATGMPKLPASIADVLVVGVGDPRAGTFIDGRQSRQDAGALRQIAARLNGTYHDANEKHLPSDLLSRLTAIPRKGAFDRLTRREYALIASGLGASVLALLPVLLRSFGTRWRPGVPLARKVRGASRPASTVAASALAAWFGLFAGAAEARGDDAPGARGDARPARIAVMVGPGPLMDPAAPTVQGIFAFKPGDNAWEQIGPPGFLDGVLSPGGRSLAAGRAAGSGASEGLWVFDLAGTAPERRVFERPWYSCCWAAEGRQILVTAPVKGGGFETCRIDADGSNPTRLPLPAETVVKDCTLDGAWLAAFDTTRLPERRARIQLVRPDGRDGHLVLDEPGVAREFRFSPDGLRLAYCLMVGEPRQPRSSVWIVGRDGGNRMRVPIEFEPGETIRPAWSPGGDRLALGVSRLVAGKVDGRILLIDLDGKNRESLPQLPGSMRLLDWK